MYQIGRYVSSNAAVWRILGFPNHGRYPSVTRLQVHLENGQRVYINDSNAMERSERPPDTTLTSFFQLTSSDEFTKTLMYNEVPQYYVWDAPQ